MKKFVLSIFAVVFAVGFTMAQDNDVKLEQLSNNNTATITQNSQGDRVEATQQGGGNNVATITQNVLDPDPNSVGLPTDQLVRLTQTGSRNRFIAETDGKDNKVNALQRGNSNRADIDVINFVSNGSDVKLEQLGDRNRATANMESPAELRAKQVGDENRLNYVSNGGAVSHKATVEQRGFSNNMDLVQDGWQHRLNADQKGDNNRLTANQFGSLLPSGSGNVINALQQGNGNTATINQNN